MDTTLGPFVVTVDGTTLPAADVATVAARLHDAVAARTAEDPSRPVHWRIDGPAGPVLWGQVSSPDPDPGWLRWWADAISAELRSYTNQDGPDRSDRPDGPVR